jgi:hypothetical protein
VSFALAASDLQEMSDVAPPAILTN